MVAGFAPTREPLLRGTEESGPGLKVLRSHRRMKAVARSEEHTSELQSQSNIVCRLLLEKKKKYIHSISSYLTVLMLLFVTSTSMSSHIKLLPFLHMFLTLRATLRLQSMRKRICVCVDTV